MTGLLALPMMAYTQVTWQYAYGGFSTEEGRSVVATSTGNYLVVGSTGSFGIGGDIYVLMLDASGLRLWSKNLGGAGVEQGWQVRELQNGGFLIAGTTNSFGNGGYDGYLARLDQNGTLQWEQAYGGEDWDFLYSVVERPDGSFLAAGETFGAGSGANDGWLIHVTSAGELDWQRTYGGAEEDLFRSISSTVDGGAIMAGGITEDGNENVWLVRVDDIGDTLWTRSLGGDSVDYAVRAIETQDGGFAGVGSTESFSEYTEAYHFKVDASGAFQWQWNWGQVNDQGSLDIRELPDGRFISVGYVNSGGSGGKDMFILFTQPNGAFQTGVTNGGDNGQDDEFGWALDLAGDGGFILCGYTRSFGSGPQDVYVVKTDSVGLTESSAVTEVFDPVGLSDLSGAAPPTASLWPVPANDKVRFSHTDPIGRADLIDLSGRPVRGWSGMMPTELDLTGLTPGPYRLIARTSMGGTISLPLIILHP